MTRAQQMQSLTSWLAVVGLLFSSLVSAGLSRRAQWPFGPLVTSGRWVTDVTGTKVTYAGVNWPGSLESMIPEGLQYQSIETIVSKVKSLGMNAIRLTYAIEMIDQYYNNGQQDVTMQKAFVDALGQDDGMKIFEQVVAENPSFGSETTRLQVFDAIAEECAKQEIYLHLDNHVSKASWCCSPLDGNSWWGDTFFDVNNWTRGLSFMAEHGKQWPSLTSMSLRNELRIPLDKLEVADTYDWEHWYENVQKGAAAIHSANPDVLIFLSGLDSDTTLTAIVQGTALSPSKQKFDRADFQGYGDDKLVLELHVYDNIPSTPTDNCSVITSRLVDAGFQTLSDNSAVNKFPLVVTEFGFPQSATTAQDPYASCLLNYFPSQHASWMIWELTGSYYIREGNKDQDENWGLLTHDWSSWRSPGFIDQLLTPAIKATMAPISDNDASGDEGSSDDNSSASILVPIQTGLMLTLGVMGGVALSSYYW
ncbi:glycoside hydrolase superfamily [Xylaria nigripes]|nr:glycoside hydrolase superfamily [Xylaria nigripes]